MSRPAPSGPPVPGRPSVPRPRLIDVVRRRFRLRLVAVVAGPGFGKSTLVSQAIEENRLLGGGRDVWVGLTPDHGATSLLVEDILAAMGAPSPLDLPTDPVEGAALVSDATWAMAPVEVAIVLDDGHLLPEGSPGLALLTHLLDRLPANGHLLLASRPPLPVPVTRLLVRGTAVVLEEADLGFSAAELRDFAAARGVDVRRLADVSRWPALTELVASTGPAHVGDYLWEEVLAGLSPERLCALQVLGAIGGADDALLAELLDVPVDLADLVHDLPLVSGSDGWWSLHPLWEPVLASGAADRLVESAVAAAPQALRRRGHPRQAMRLLLGRGAWDEAGELIVDVCAGISPAVPIDVLSGWLAVLPDAVRAGPAGMLLEATIDKGPDPMTARSLLEAATADYAAQGHRAGELACELGLFHIAFSRNEIDRMRSLISRWDELGSEDMTSAPIVAALGRALLAPDPASARSALEQLPARTTPSTAVLADWVRAHLLLLTLGDAELAVARARDVLPIAPATLRGSIRCELVEGLRLLGRTAEALEELPALLADEPVASMRTPRPLAAGVVLHALRGDLDAASRLLARLEDAVSMSPLPWAAIAAAVGGAAVAAASGDDAGAAAAIERIRTHPMALPLVLLRVSPAALPLQYVLDPGSRAAWDAIDLPGIHERLRRLAAAVAAVREDGDPRALADLSDIEVSAAVGLLPQPWVAGLAAALAVRSPDTGVRLVHRLGPGTRPALRLLEDGGGPLAGAARSLLSVVPAMPTHHLEIRVLGPLVVLRDGVEVDDANSRRARVRQLLGYLVEHGQSTRHELAAALWPDLGETDGARNLRVTLNYLQKLLEPDRDERDAPFFLRARGSLLELAADDALRIDLRDYREAVAEAERAEASGTPSLALAAYRRAVAGHGGELLADLPPDGWLVGARESLRRKHTRVVLRAGQLLLAAGDTAAADDLAGLALGLEPWSEEAYRIRVGALMARGDRAAAQRELDRLFDMLDELGVPAAGPTFEMARQLRGGVA